MTPFGSISFGSTCPTPTSSRATRHTTTSSWKPGLLRAKGLIACLSADTDNLFVCLSARDMVAGLTIVARAYEEESIDKLYRAGADQVVSPNFSSAVRKASMVLRPSVISFVDILTGSPRPALRMEQLRVDAGSRVSGRTWPRRRFPNRPGW